eukprot:gnl/Carplike_NY0171/1268_a1714_1230.p1 GENE.gnl/Carplike_NY0171/1268_a1714_1230~~gnl/Carplike_NY0171/1268_a1714_1230.p1  ORF type:complete len:582 (-),score=181.22 gnl/Carplike_NY0171/1268_a1714_1230:73-1614(-)
MAEELVTLLDLVGGPEHIHVLLQPLELLACVDAKAVRDAAVESLKKISAKLPQQHITHFINLVLDLLAGEWFNYKTSGAGLVAQAYSRTQNSDHKERLIKAYELLGSDELPMVRRSCAETLSDVVSVVEEGVAREKLLPLFEKLQRDEQDSVRSVNIANAHSFLKKLQTSDSDRVFVVFENSARDEAWRVRRLVAESLFSLLQISSQSKTTFCKVLKALLLDKEPEVRCCASVELSRCCVLIDSRDLLVTYILPQLEELVKDDADYVRAAIAGSLSSVSTVVGKDITVSRLRPLLARLLSDDKSDVRLAVIDNIVKVIDVAGVDIVEDMLFKAVFDLAKDPAWRVRRSVISIVPVLAKKLDPSKFEDSLAPLCNTWLGDAVFAIRQAAIENMKALTQIYSMAWAQTVFIPKLKALSEDTNYLFRITALFAISSLISEFTGDVIGTELLPIVIRLARDSVANVRFTAATTLGDLAKYLDKRFVLQKIKPILMNLSSEDPDVDVQNFAALALTKL